MKKSSVWFSVLFVLLVTSVSMANPRYHALEGAYFDKGNLTVNTTDGWTLTANARGVEIRLNFDLKGTYILLANTPRMTQSFTMETMVIYVRSGAIKSEWEERIKEYLFRYERPSDVVPKMKR